MFRYHYDLLGRLSHFDEDMVALFGAADLGEYKAQHSINSEDKANHESTNATIVRRQRKRPEHAPAPCLLRRVVPPSFALLLTW